jgi:molybdopterin converting factor subunit 1
MISVNVKFFGPLRDVVKRDELTLDLSDMSTGEEAFGRLVALSPDLKKWRQSVRLAINLEYVQFTDGLKAGDEVSFIPPVSGG